ncbi:MAG: HlyD family efflux transporter periplasmic adaptor subunit [Phycisphaerae bacterium]|nr:HlyD family efflux transporter periplasmic adaptor subunit [Phycisphaerae bacterium]
MTHPDTARRDNAQTAGRAASRGDVYADIVRIARTGTSQAQFLRAAFRLIAQHFASPYAALHVRYASEVIQDDWHTGPTDPGFWKPSLQQFLTESLSEPLSRARLLQARTGSAKVAFLSAPVFDPSGPAIGAVSLVVAPVEPDQVDARLALLECLTRLTSFSVEYLGNAESRSDVTGRSAASSRDPAGAKALSRAASFQDHEELAFAIVNDLCNRMGCEQVALGLVDGPRVHPVAISGLDTVRSQSPGVVAIRGAMEECLDAGTTIVEQSGQSWNGSESSGSYRLHHQWRAHVQGDAVASIPLKDGDRVVAVLSLRRRADHPLRQELVEEIRSRVEPFAVSMLVLKRAGRGLVRHALDVLREGAVSLTRPDGMRRRALVAAAVFGFLFFCFGSINYRPTVQGVLAPADVRHVAAPFDGVLASVHAVEGDHVRAGDPLVVFEQRELITRRDELQAELAVVNLQIDQARAADTPVEMQLARAKQALIEARLRVLEEHLTQATVRAPIDGTVVSGDLRRFVGGVVPRGQALFDIAPPGHWRLELALPDHVSVDLETGLSGTFAPAARPDHLRAFHIDRVLASAQVRGGRNVFVAEADIHAEEGWLRPGMEGVARVDMGKRRIWWVALHRAIDWIRLNVWP